LCAHVVAEPANAGLGDHKLAAGELQGDPAFFFGALGFEDGGIAFNRRDASALALVRVRTLRSFVFINARKFDLKTLLTQRPDFEFTVFRFPSAVHLSCCDTLVSTSLHRKN